MKTVAKRNTPATLEQLEDELAHALTGTTWMDASWSDIYPQEQHDCDACRRRVRAKGLVWLELNWSDNLYRPLGRTTTRRSQGCFPFHTICAIRKLARTATGRDE